MKKAFDFVGKFVGPIVDSISETFDSLKMWAVNNIGIPKITLGSIKNPITGTVYELPSIGPYYPFKKDTSSSAPEKSEVKTTKPTDDKKAPETDPSKTSPTNEPKSDSPPQRASCQPFKARSLLALT